MSLGRHGVVTAVALFVVLAGLTGGRLASQATRSAPAAPPTDASSAARDERGAVAAAMEHLRLLGSEEMYDASARQRLLRARVEPAEFEELDHAYALAGENLGVAADGSAPEGVVVSRLVPVGHRVESFSPERAVVAVWAVGLLGVAGPTSRMPVQASWSTETVTMEWRDDGWRWIGVERREGPAPVGSAQIPAPADVMAAAAVAFEEPGHAR